jgi:MFS family permease
LTSVAATSALSGGVRFIWSSLLDKTNFKVVYGTILIIQILLVATIQFATFSKLKFLIWVCTSNICETGIFAVSMSVLPRIFEEHAAKISGFGFCYTGFCGLISAILVKNFLTTFGYMTFYISGGVTSLMAFVILVFVFKEETY